MINLKNKPHEKMLNVGKEWEVRKTNIGSLRSLILFCKS